MKIQYCSDLHMEIWKKSFPQIVFDEDTNVIVFAGDISNDEDQALDYMASLVEKGYTVIYVAGNHEYYRHEFEDQFNALKKACEEEGVIFLENETFELNGANFIGATLWTDYEALPFQTKEQSMIISGRSLNDHFVINHEGGKFSPEYAREMNQASKEFIKGAIKPDMKNVIITHHAPTLHAVAPQFHNDRLNPAFVNDWTDYVKELKADVWIYGHTHHDISVEVGQTIVTSRQLGYPGERLRNGNFGEFVPGEILL